MSNAPKNTDQTPGVTFIERDALGDGDDFTPPPAPTPDHTEILAANGYQVLADQIRQIGGQAAAMPVEIYDAVITTTERQIKTARAAGHDTTGSDLDLRVMKAVRHLNREMAKVASSAQTAARLRVN